MGDYRGALRSRARAYETLSGNGVPMKCLKIDQRSLQF
jgi:hypothetical protein